VNDAQALGVQRDLASGDGSGRGRYDAALRSTRERAFEPGQFAGQESFMTAREILALARRGGVRRSSRVVDLWCGVAGPGRLVTRALGCDYLGVDADAEAVALARERADGLPCRFEVGSVPPVPEGGYDVVLLLETLLAFPDQPALLRQVAGALRPGGRFAFTVEQGHQLTGAERRLMPAADTVHLTPEGAMVDRLERVGLRVVWQHDVSDAHRRTAAALADALVAEQGRIVPRLGRRRWTDLLAAHRLWADWLASGRVRKLAVVALRSRSQPSSCS
jgi:SAM-dependent methyltransferase